MARKTTYVVRALAGAMVVALCGCSDFVKKTDFDSAISELRSNDQKQQQEIDAIRQEMQQKFAQYDAQITAMQGRISVNTIAHFDTDKSNIREDDKKKLDDFANIIKAHHTDAVITTEGFADPSGSAAHNKRLSQRRADAVRDYLVQTGGLPAGQVRAVGYGEVKNRQVVKGAHGDEGQPNRRVTIVTDFLGAGSMSSSSATGTTSG
ncbi:OmpA family protein [Dyella solisilvae]|uniref:OmpA family protein n=1 Tax=Dyella solisilvae TaxID=1920168 RepID=A0A370KEN5_9GAMM|nr:OmpA family protein [Dyella solisilvae]RDJ00571.1 OmpA family protein [Dyella solisilvae]